MKFNKWTVALAAIGVVSLASAARADEAAPKMIALQTALSNTTISGYVDTAATWRPGTDLNRTVPVANTPPYSFTQNDGFSLNAVDIAIDHPEDESPWAAGYHAELMMGQDPVGLLFAGAGTIRQAYVTLRTPVGNGIDWKMGVWDTVVGYESNSDPLNPNYTRSYGYTIEPTTHTGVLATYKINDMVTVQAGIADDSNATGTIGVNPALAESQKAYMGDVQFTAPDSAGFLKGATLTLALVDAAGNNTTSFGSTSLYAGMSLPTPITALKLGACFDYLEIHDSNGLPNGNAAANSSEDSIWNLAVYASIQATDKLSFNTRAEYLDGEAGPPVVANVFAPPIGGRYSAFEFTGTVQYNLWMNVISRAEFRWDHATSGNSFGATVDRRNDFLLALNLIYQF